MEKPFGEKRRGVDKRQRGSGVVYAPVCFIAVAAATRFQAAVFRKMAFVAS
jgi:hypothetical protein